MSNENQVTEVAKKPRRVFKFEQTGQEIAKEINDLTAKVEELESAVNNLDPAHVVYSLVNDALEDAREALNKALTTVHHS
jgi:exonuclease VII small subunit